MLRILRSDVRISKQHLGLGVTTTEKQPHVGPPDSLNQICIWTTPNQRSISKYNIRVVRFPRKFKNWKLKALPLSRFHNVDDGRLSPFKIG